MRVRPSPRCGRSARTRRRSEAASGRRSAGNGARLDYVGILAYVDEQRPGLAERFEAAFREHLAILRTDAVWPVVRGDSLRLLPMDRPWDKYGLFFTITDDEVHVVAVCHLARNLKRHLRDR